MYQGDVFLNNYTSEQLLKEVAWRVRNEPFDLDLHKKGVKCLLCQRERKAYGYELNQTMADLALRLFSYCRETGLHEFLMTEALSSDIEHRSEVYKLKPLGLIERVGDKWFITKDGMDWINDDIELPRKVWVFDDKVVYKDPIKISISQVVVNWKSYQDWINDAVGLSYKELLSNLCVIGEY